MASLEPRLSLPLLPTLATAVLIGLGSLLCREAAAPASPAPAPDAQAFHAAAPLDALPPRAPAALIFAEHYPLAVAGLAPVPAIRSAPAPKLASAPVRRPCPLPRCPEAQPHRPDAIAALRAAEAPAGKPADRTQEAEAEAEDGILPDLALPFAPSLAPALRAVDGAAAFVRARVSAIGGSVSVMADRMH